MKKIRILALGTTLALGFAMGAHAQTQSTIDSEQPTAQSEDKASPTTDQQTTTPSEPQSAPAPEDNSDGE